MEHVTIYRPRISRNQFLSDEYLNRTPKEATPVPVDKPASHRCRRSCVPRNSSFTLRETFHEIGRGHTVSNGCWWIQRALLEIALKIAILYLSNYVDRLLSLYPRLYFRQYSLGRGRPSRVLVFMFTVTSVRLWGTSVFLANEQRRL
jgi:hypothetical protein